MDLFEKNGNCLYILNILKKYTDADHLNSIAEIKRKVKEIYDVDIDPRTIRRNINLLKYKLNDDITTREENGKGYYIDKDPNTDFEAGEIRAIIDTFSYSNYIVPSVAEGIIEKCKNLQNIYENEKLKDYKIYALDTKTQNQEVIKNIEDISQSIINKNKIKFEYWKYSLSNKLERQIVSTPTVSPYAIVYNKQEFYLIGIKDGQEDFYHYRLDRIKNVEQLEDKVKPKKEKEIKDFAVSTVEMFGGKTENITAICDNLLLDEVIERFGKDIIISTVNEKQFKITVNVNELGFKFWAMRNLDLVKIIAPDNLKIEMNNIITNAYEKYNQ